MKRATDETNARDYESLCLLFIIIQHLHISNNNHGYFPKYCHDVRIFINSNVEFMSQHGFSCPQTNIILALLPVPVTSLCLQIERDITLWESVINLLQGLEHSYTDQTIQPKDFYSQNLDKFVCQIIMQIFLYNHLIQ